MHVRVWIVDYSRSAYDTILHINHYAELRLHDLAGRQTRGDFSSSNRVYKLCRFFYPLFAWYKATLLTYPVPGCQVCTIVGPNEDDCSPLPSSLGCTPEKSSTVLTADTSGVTVGTLTGSALYSAITSGLDQVCQVPPNNGATSAYTCTETATATLAPDIIYYDTGVGEAQFKFDGSLTLQVTEANYDNGMHQIRLSLRPWHRTLHKVSPSQYRWCSHTKLSLCAVVLTQCVRQLQK